MRSGLLADIAWQARLGRSLRLSGQAPSGSGSLSSRSVAVCAIWWALAAGCFALSLVMLRRGAGQGRLRLVFGMRLGAKHLVLVSAWCRVVRLAVFPPVYKAAVACFIGGWQFLGL